MGFPFVRGKVVDRRSVVSVLFMGGICGWGVCWFWVREVWRFADVGGSRNGYQSILVFCYWCNYSDDVGEWIWNSSMHDVKNIFLDSGEGLFLFTADGF